MRNRNTINKILADIMRSAGISAEMEEKLEIVRDELNEREDIIKGTCQGWNDEGEDSFTVTPNQAQSDDYKSKYETLKQQYIDRFFNPPAPGQPHEPEIETPSIEEPAPKPISDLFKEV